MNMCIAALLATALLLNVQASAGNPYGKCSAPDKGLTDEVIIKHITQHSLRSHLYKDGTAIPSTERLYPDNTYRSEMPLPQDGRLVEHYTNGTWSLKNGIVTRKPIPPEGLPSIFSEPSVDVIESISGDTMTVCIPATGARFPVKLIPIK